MKNGSKQYEKVLRVLLGSPDNEVTKEALETTLANEIQMYRLSTYIWDLKKKMGGDVKVIKDGKNIKAYKLLNPNKFKDFSKAPVVTQIAKAAATIKPAGKKNVPKDANASKDVPTYSIDPGFDNFDISEVVKGL